MTLCAEKFQVQTKALLKLLYKVHGFEIWTAPKGKPHDMSPGDTVLKKKGGEGDFRDGPLDGGGGWEKSPQKFSARQNSRKIPTDRKAKKKTSCRE